MKQGSRVFTSPQLPEAMQSLQVSLPRCSSCLAKLCPSNPVCFSCVSPRMHQITPFPCSVSQSLIGSERRSHLTRCLCMTQERADQVGVALETTPALEAYQSNELADHSPSTSGRDEGPIASGHPLGVAGTL